MLRHDLRFALRVIVLEAVADALRHHLTDRRVAGGPLLRDRTYDDIPFGDHADETVVFADGSAPRLSARIQRAASRMVLLGSAMRTFAVMISWTCMTIF
jgi:hypothetical protein